MRSTGSIPPPSYSSQQDPHPPLSVSYHPGPASGTCTCHCCSCSRCAGSGSRCRALPATTDPATHPAADSGHKAESLAPHRPSPTQPLHPPPQNPPGRGQGATRRCLPREGCPGPLRPHVFLKEAEDGRWVPISLADQRHIVPFLHQRRGRPHLHLQVLGGVWGQGRAGSVPSPAAGHQRGPPGPRLTEDVDLDLL